MLDDLVNSSLTFSDSLAARLSSMSIVTPVSSRYLSAIFWKPPPWFASPESQNLTVFASVSSPPPMKPAST